MTKKPHKLRGGHIQAARSIPGLGLLGVPGLRDATEKAARAEADAMRAVLWAHNYGLSIQHLSRMTLEDFANHIRRNTAWGAVEIPSYVLATIAAMQPTEPPVYRARAVTCEECATIDESAPDALTKIHTQPKHAGFRYTDGERIDGDKYEVANGPDGPMTFETDHIPPLPDELITAEGPGYGYPDRPIAPWETQ